MSTASPALSESPLWPYIAAAAVLTDFAADRLRPLGGGTPDIATVGEMLMEWGEPIRIGPARGRWSLSGTSRRAALAELQRSGTLDAAIQANPGDDHPDNPTQRALDSLLLTRSTPVMAHQSLNDLLGVERALELVKPVVTTSPDLLMQLSAQIERLRLLEPLQKLLAHGFAGRTAESRTLREYVDELQSESFKEMLARKLDNVMDIFRTRPVLVIWGPGGVGKSTLIAKFILDHAGPERPKPTPFVYLDFDRGQLDPLQPDSLLEEALRQIQVQFPEFSQQAATLEADAKTRFFTQDRATPSRSGHFEQSAQLRQQFASLIGRISRASGGTAVLLFIDTFEVVQRRGPSPVYNVLTLAAQLVQAMPRLRPVIIGRAPVRDSDFNAFADQAPRWKSLPLAGFDQDAGRLYLQARLSKLGRDCVDAAALDRIVSLVRGNPLSLRLAAQVFSKEGTRALEDAVAEAEFEASFTQERLQGLLHNRIVAGLEETVRKIADPGLIVRRLTPEVIQHVLARACQLQITTLAEAQMLFMSLQLEVSLFESTEPMVLRHRPDVRLLMLPLLRAKLGEQARAIDEAAVRFWFTRTDPEARAEEIYHHLWLGATSAQLEAVWNHGPASKALLEEALDEFEALEGPLEGRIWLCNKLGREISGELELKANLTEWERNAALRAESLLSSGSPEEALKALRSRSERTPNSILPLLEIEALKLLGRDQEALEIVTGALERARGGHAPAHVLSLVLRKSWLYERLSRFTEALEWASRAVTLATSLGDTVLRFEAKLTQTRLIRLLGTDRLTAEKEELARMIDEPAVRRALEERPALVLESASEVGDLRPELFILSDQRLSKGGSHRQREALSLITGGVAHVRKAEFEQARRAFERARDIAADSDDFPLLAQALLQLAGVYFNERNLSRAAACVQEALVLAQKIEDPTLEFQARGILGNVLLHTRDLYAARAEYERSLQIARHLHNRFGEADALGNLANVSRVTGSHVYAIELLQEALQIRKELGDRRGERQTMASLGDAYNSEGDTDRAMEHYSASLEIARTLGDVLGLSSTLHKLGMISAHLQRWDQAEAYFQETLQIEQQLGDLIDQADTLGNLATVYARSGRLEEAQRLYVAQLELATKTNHAELMARARENLNLVSQQLTQPQPDAMPSLDHDPGIGPHATEVQDSSGLEIIQSSVDDARVSNEALIHQQLPKK